jgi:hypothetical protein
MSSALVRAAEIKLKTMDWPTKQSFISARWFSTHFLVGLSARLLLRGATQKPLRCLLRGLEHLNTPRQLPRNAPFPHTRRIHSRLIKPSQAIAILRGTRDILALQLWQSRKK